MADGGYSSRPAIIPSWDEQRRRLQQLMDSPARTPASRSRVYATMPASPLAPAGSAAASYPRFYPFAPEPAGLLPAGNAGIAGRGVAGVAGYGAGGSPGAHLASLARHVQELAAQSRSLAAASERGAAAERAAAAHLAAAAAFGPAFEPASSSFQTPTKPLLRRGGPSPPAVLASEGAAPTALASLLPTPPPLPDAAAPGSGGSGGGGRSGVSPLATGSFHAAVDAMLQTASRLSGGAAPYAAGAARPPDGSTGLSPAAGPESVRLVNQLTDALEREQHARVAADAERARARETEQRAVQSAVRRGKGKGGAVGGMSRLGAST